MANATWAKSEDVSTDVFTSNIAVGSPTEGYDFGLIGNTKKWVEEIRVSITATHIGRLMVRKSDGTCLTIGSTGGDPKEIWRFNPTEKFSLIQLYSKNKRLVGIRLSTDRQTNLHVFVPGCENLSDDYSKKIRINEGCESCIGVFGNARECVDSLGFAMLKRK